MPHRTHTTTFTSRRIGRILPVLAASAALMAGCGMSVDADQARDATTTSIVTVAREAGAEPALNETAPEGTVRKVGAKWFEFTGGEWTPVTHGCGPSTRKCFLPTP